MGMRWKWHWLPFWMISVTHPCPIWFLVVFDTIDHGILRDQLRESGVGHMVLCWSIPVSGHCLGEIQSLVPTMWSAEMVTVLSQHLHEATLGEVICSLRWGIFHMLMILSFTYLPLVNWTMLWISYPGACRMWVSACSPKLDAPRSLQPRNRQILGWMSKLIYSQAGCSRRRVLKYNEVGIGSCCLPTLLK